MEKEVEEETATATATVRGQPKRQRRTLFPIIPSH